MGKGQGGFFAAHQTKAVQAAKYGKQLMDKDRRVVPVTSFLINYGNRKQLIQLENEEGTTSTQVQ